MIVRDFTDTAGMRSAAIFSDCERYRYRLWREWDRGKGAIAFLMLNPSTADERVNDPTIERCQRRAVAMGYGRLEIVNLFPLRATDPAVMMADADPVGPRGRADGAILDAVSAASITVCGWGNHGGHLGRADAVTRIIALVGLRNRLHALKITGKGHPQHPLYVGYSVKPKRIEWWE